MPGTLGMAGHAPAGDGARACCVRVLVRCARAWSPPHLLVPGREERVGHVQPLAVQAELDHLRPATQLVALHRRDDRLLGGVLREAPQHPDAAAGADGAAHPDPPGELGVRGVGDVVLRNVAAQPVGEVDEPAAGAARGQCQGQRQGSEVSCCAMPYCGGSWREKCRTLPRAVQGGGVAQERYMSLRGRNSDTPGTHTRNEGKRGRRTCRRG